MSTTHAPLTPPPTPPLHLFRRASDDHPGQLRRAMRELDDAHNSLRIAVNTGSDSGSAMRRITLAISQISDLCYDARKLEWADGTRLHRPVFRPTCTVPDASINPTTDI